MQQEDRPRAIRQPLRFNYVRHFATDSFSPNNSSCAHSTLTSIKKFTREVGSRARIVRWIRRPKSTRVEIQEYQEILSRFLEASGVRATSFPGFPHSDIHRQCTSEATIFQAAEKLVNEENAQKAAEQEQDKPKALENAGEAEARERRLQEEQAEQPETEAGAETERPGPEPEGILKTQGFNIPWDAIGGDFTMTSIGGNQTITTETNDTKNENSGNTTTIKMLNSNNNSSRIIRE